ncbi:HlyU family transcriptional regulator [Pelagimonas varians]|uniref:Transcriptional activator HlyU n=1 Tax=Pelagimonas varians TaxID=696760 RepID=A0A238K4P2_9RHOB|nr:HlyU family transcriptional regulator [Pelagimonas varians]PYG27053.1 hypothetical protein C8N36_11876 [Pelagimonas varians]SMX37072.1 Transcriptional activator HlyU [Pelagimonas varians]
MSLLKRLFGGGSKPDPAPAHIDYKGFRITPTPVNEGGQFRIGALIEGEVDGEPQSHTLIRADMIRDLGEANEASVNKAKQMIDQMGDRVFRS